MGTGYALRQLAKKLTPPDVLPAVSILKPLKGVEAGFDENVGSFFALDYPAYEILFSVADANDPAARAVGKLMAAHPNVAARLIVGARELGPNPKVNNLLQSYDAARFDVLLISDSNIRVAPDYLKRVIAHLKPDVGVVTAVVAGRDGRGLGGLLETTYLNSFYARWMQVAAATGKACVVGKQMLFRRSTMDRLGGIATFGRYLAEDYMAGEGMRRLGLKVVIGYAPVPQFVGRHDLGAFWSRHVRWGRIRKAQAPLAFAVEPLMGPILSGVAGAAALHGLFGIPVGYALTAHLGAWCACDLALMTALEKRVRPKNVVGWILREALHLPLWIHIASGQGVNWRGNRLTLRAGGLVERAAG